jgi:iron complex outermembrane receptor protein
VKIRLYGARAKRRLGETATTFELPSYTLTRLFANWQVSSKVEIFAQIHNLFDQTYYTNSFARFWVQPGAPRTASGGVRVRF